MTSRFPGEFDSTPLAHPGATPDTLLPGKPIRIAAGPLVAEIQPGCGGRLARLARRDPRGDAFDYLVSMNLEAFASDAWPKAGCFPMLPYTNQLRDDTLDWQGKRIVAREAGASSSLHGWGLRRPWEVVDESAHCCVLQLDSPAQAEWPWHYQAYLSYTLDADGLDVQLSLTNLSAQPMPAGLGLHPYFRWPAGARLSFTAQALWQSPSEAIRWPSVAVTPAREEDGKIEIDSVGGGLDADGRSTWFTEVPDDEAGGASLYARIYYADGVRSATVRSDDASWLVAHSPAQRPYLCLEPSTHRVGAFDDDHFVVAHGETVSIGMRIDLT